MHSSSFTKCRYFSTWAALPSLKGAGRNVPFAGLTKHIIHSKLPGDKLLDCFAVGVIHAACGPGYVFIQVFLVIQRKPAFRDGPR